MQAVTRSLCRSPCCGTGRPPGFPERDAISAPDIFVLRGDDPELNEAERKIIELDAEPRALMEGVRQHWGPPNYKRRSGLAWLAA